MYDKSASSCFQTLFEVALQNYEKQTGTTLTKHPLTQQLQDCHSVESVMAVLEHQARALSRSGGSDGRVTRPLKSAVSVLFALSASTLGEAIGLPFPPAKAIFAGFAILLSAANDVSSSYDALVDLLESIEHFLNRLEIYTKISPTEAMVKIIVKILVELLSTLALVTKQIRQKKPIKFVKKLLGEHDVEAVLQRLDRLTLDEARTTAAQTLEVVYSLVQNMGIIMADGKASIACVQNVLRLLQQIATNTNKSKSAKMQKNFRQWLSPPDPWESHNTAHKSRHSGTAEWFIKGSVFSDWKLSPTCSLLWIHGKPGAGKTVLCSEVIRDIDALRKDGDAFLAFFYFDFREDQKKELRGLLSSLLVQLCHQSDSYYDVLSAFYSEHGSGSQHASDDALVSCLKDLLKLPGQIPVYLVVDGLDECPITADMPSPREEVLNFIDDLVKSKLPNLRICLTSRPEIDVKVVLRPLTSYSVSLHREKGQMQDIDKYISFVVNTDKGMRKWNAKDKQLVIDTLTKRADGMFRWVYCQVAYLRGCLPGRIRHALAELPETLDETYERTLRRINKVNWEFAHRLFQCVAVASRPLSVKELAEFLAFDFETGSIAEFHESWRLEDPVAAVLSTCSTLLAVVNVNGSKVIQFSHFSVKEYLTSSRLIEKCDVISSRFHVSVAAAHTLVAQACLGLLLHFDDDTTAGSVKTFPLAEYATRHWVGHAQCADALSSLQDGIKLLFDPRRPHLAVWVWIYDLEGSLSQTCWVEKPPRPSGSPLHYAALYCSATALEFLVTEYPEDVNARSQDDSSTPLHRAAGNGRAEVVRILLEHGADPIIQNKRGWAPLHRASDRGHAEVVSLLIGYGAGVSTRDKQGWTPLHWAADRGHVEVAGVLLEHGADAAAPDEQGWTPLHRASDQGHAELARVLLERGGADVTARDKYGWTPLRHATEKGRLEVVRVLLAHGAGATTNYTRDPPSQAGLASVLPIPPFWVWNSSAREVHDPCSAQGASAGVFHNILRAAVEP